MTKLKFRTFTFPENPRACTVTARRTPCYDSSGAFTGMSAGARTITGSGTFFGLNAFSTYNALAALLDGSAGTLEHPVLGSCQAYLTELTMTQQPGENRVDYAFTFRETDASGGIPK